MMTGYAFTFACQTMIARASGALWWPDQGLLVVADLHFGKSERLARRGGALLPPYDMSATLARLDAEIAATQAAHVLCLGDSFDDGVAAQGIEDSDRLWLLRLMAGRRWTWIAGNHDPGPLNLGGSHLAELLVAGIALRHIAQSRDCAEISGHYHPKHRLAGQSRPCFLIDQSRIILPAFGAYTGGMLSHDPLLSALMQPDALAVLTGPRALACPLYEKPQRR